MICPIISANDKGNVKCLETNCAWFIDNMCSMLSIAIDLDNIVGNMAALGEDKL